MSNSRKRCICRKSFTTGCWQAEQKKAIRKEKRRVCRSVIHQRTSYRGGCCGGLSAWCGAAWCSVAVPRQEAEKEVDTWSGYVFQRICRSLNTDEYP